MHVYVTQYYSILIPHITYTLSIYILALTSKVIPTCEINKEYSCSWRGQNRTYLQLMPHWTYLQNSFCNIPFIQMHHAQSSLASSYNYIPCIRSVTIQFVHFLSLPHVWVKINLKRTQTHNHYSQITKCIYALGCCLAESMYCQAVHQILGRT